MFYKFVDYLNIGHLQVNNIGKWRQKNVIIWCCSMTVGINERASDEASLSRTTRLTEQICQLSRPDGFARHSILEKNTWKSKSDLDGDGLMLNGTWLTGKLKVANGSSRSQERTVIVSAPEIRSSRRSKWTNAAKDPSSSSVKMKRNGAKNSTAK